MFNTFTDTDRKQCVLTLPHSGRPGWVLVLSPVMESLFSFLARRSSAICRPMAFMSFLLSADVMYMCISRKRPDGRQQRCYFSPSGIPPPDHGAPLRVPPSGSSSAWSISSLVSRLTNHSNDFWSLLIQMKSTCRVQNRLKSTSTHMKTHRFSKLMSKRRGGFLTLRNFMSLSLMFSHQE